jgi:peptide/nickel transport system permease protein
MMADAVASAGASGQTTLASPEAPKLVSQRQRALSTFTGNRTAVVGLAMILVIVFIAIAAPLLAPHDPLQQSVSSRLDPPTSESPLGLDDKGRDILSRVIYGARIALMVGFFSVVLGGALGTAIGVVSGYFGGKIESALMRLTDVMLAFPDLITGLLVLAVLGPGLWKMIFAIGLTIAPRFARVAYGPTLAIKGKEFVEAARSIGASNRRIIFRHMLPNAIGVIIVNITLVVAIAILTESLLSFLGFGIQPPTPTWGNMLEDGRPQMTYAGWLVWFPGLAILLTVLCVNFLGDGLRDALDPTQRRVRA